MSDVRKVVEPVIENNPEKPLIWIDFSFCRHQLGGSAFAQSVNKIGTEAPTVTSPERFISTFNAIQELVEKGLIAAGHDIGSGGLITTLLEMCFSGNQSGLDLDLTGIGEEDTVRLLFSENPGVVIQSNNRKETEKILTEAGAAFVNIGRPLQQRLMTVKNHTTSLHLNINHLRDLWFKTSYLLDRKQSGEVKSLERFFNYKRNELNFNFGGFTGKAADYGIDLQRRTPSGIKAAIIREKGVNGDREMAYMLYLAGFDVKDVHMTDLISGRENLEEINLIVFVGGFSNSDVLGSAKGWAGAFKYNEAARTALENFYAREDTLSLGVCNGCQLMVELGLTGSENGNRPHMAHNDSHKFESGFVNVDILPNQSVMLQNMEGLRLGVWIAHGEGKFMLPGSENQHHIPMKYSRDFYPANPNGSAFNAAAICSANGRHLAMMPHLERAFRPYHWAYYPGERTGDEITPWMMAFVNAREWIWERL